MNDKFVVGVINTTNDNFYLNCSYCFFIKTTKTINVLIRSFLLIASPIFFFNSMGCIYNKNMIFIKL